MGGDAASGPKTQTKINISLWSADENYKKGKPERCVFIWSNKGRNKHPLCVDADELHFAAAHMENDTPSCILENK